MVWIGHHTAYDQLLKPVTPAERSPRTYCGAVCGFFFLSNRVRGCKEPGHDADSEPEMPAVL
jgi:hypothetical protein